MQFKSCWFVYYILFGHNFYNGYQIIDVYTSINSLKRGIKSKRRRFRDFVVYSYTPNDNRFEEFSVCFDLEGKPILC